MSEGSSLNVKKRKGDKEKLVETIKDEIKSNQESLNSDESDSVPVNPRFGPMPNVKNVRLWTRFVIILGSLAVVYFTSTNETIFAKQKDVLEHRKQNVNCSQSYKKEIYKYPACIPAKCGRAVMDKLITSNEVETLRDLAVRGLSLGGSSGGASILDLHSGALSKGENFINVYKLPSSVFTHRDFIVYRAVRTKIQEAVAHSFGISSSALYLTHPTFFSRLTNEPAVTIHDEYWHPHVDKETYKSFHYTSLLYLSDYGPDFKGGRFLFLEPDNSSLVVEPRKGRVSMFTSGSENTHWVEKVKSGIRFALTVSFTCDKGEAISDPKLPAGVVPTDEEEEEEDEGTSPHQHSDL